MLSTSSNGETRIVLTEQCNYRCIFCHNEGMDDSVESLGLPDEARLRKSLDEVMAGGCRDITFTGGEPLLRRDLLLSMIQHIRTCDLELPVTIVTNGSLLTLDYIQALAELGGVRFNVSFHASDNPTYCRVTGQNRFSLAALGQQLAQLRSAKIPFKLNCVALRSTMPDKESVAGLIEFSQQHGATALKIIELLMVEQNQSLISEHLSLESVEKRLPAEFELKANVARGEIFCHRLSGFTVELRKCRCHFGCEECLRTQQTASLDSSGQYWSCFAWPNNRIDLADTGYEKAVSKGDQVLHAMRQRYGTGSPSLHRQSKLIPEKSHVWFRLHDEADLQSILNGADLEQHRQFSGTFLKPAFSADGLDVPDIHIRCNLENPENAMLIMSRLTLENRGPLIIHHTRFFDSERIPIKASADYLEQFMLQMGWRRTLEVQSGEKIYRLRDSVFSLIEIERRHRLIGVDVRLQKGICLAESLSERPGFQSLAIPLPQLLEHLVSFTT